MAHIAAGFAPADLVSLARALDDAAASLGVDLLGGFSANVENGTTSAAEAWIESLPEALAVTRHVCASVQVGTTRHGLNMDAVGRVAVAIKRMAERTSGEGGFAAAKFVVFMNQPDDNPFMAGAIHGLGQPDAVINIGVSGPGVIARAVERRLAQPGDAPQLQDLAEEIKRTSFRVTRTGELIGRYVADRLGLPFGSVDLSLAPTPDVGDSVGEIIRLLGVDAVGAPGTTAIVAMLNDAVKKGGAFASSSVGGLSGAFLPVCEDRELARAAADGSLTLEKLEAMTSVCSVGLDMIAIPGDTDAATLTGSDRRRDGDRARQQQDDRGPGDPRARKGGRRVRGLRRTLRRERHPAGAQHGQVEPVRSVRREDPGAAALAAQLTAGSWSPPSPRRIAVDPARRWCACTGSPTRGAPGSSCYRRWSAATTCWHRRCPATPERHRLRT